MSGKVAYPLLAALAVVAVIAGTVVARQRAASLLAPAIDAERRAELTIAWPVLYAHAALAQWQVVARSGSTANREALAVPPDEVPPFTAWQAQPVADRWARYTSAEWPGARRITRTGGAVFAALLVVLIARLVGWPLLRGGWFVAALVLTRRPGRPGTSHGSARWASARELRGRQPRAGRADLVVGRVGRRAVAVREEEQYEHLLLVAPTGAGKTSGLILPNLLREPGTRSLVVTDPKRELLRLTSPYLRSVYGEANVLALDFLDAGLSAGYNPLARVTDAASADLFAQTWVRNTGTSKEPFWDNAARTLLGAAALHLVKTEEVGVVPPLAALVDFLCGLPAEAVTEALADSPVPEARRLARGFLTNMAKNERLVGSVFAELPPRFACLNLESVRRVTSVDEVDPARLATTPTVLYLALDLDHARTLAPLTACLFRDLFAALAAVAKARPDGRLPVPVLAYLDEFGTIGHIPEFQARLATVRSARIGCLLVVQDLAQLTKEYGREDADTILTNATTKLCLAGVTHDDAAYFSKLAGTATVHATNRGSTHPLLLPWADRGNRGVGEVARPLVTPDELRTLGDDVLVVAGRHHPVRARQARYYQERVLRSRLPDPAVGDPLAHFRRCRAARPLPAPGDPLPLESPEDAPWPPDVAAPRADALSGRAAPARGAPAPAAAPRPPAAPPAAPARTALETVAPSVAVDAHPRPTLTPSQRALVAALAGAGKPGSQVSSGELAAMTGQERAAVRRELRAIREALDLDQWADIADAARERGLLADGVPPSAGGAGPGDVAVAPGNQPRLVSLPALTTGEAALLRAICAAPGASSTGWAAELGVSPSRVRQLLGALRQKTGAPTTEALAQLAQSVVVDAPESGPE